MYPYYQFSSWGNRRDIVTWEEHFEALNIPYAVTADTLVGADYTSTEYCLWRMGKEYQSDRIAVNQTPVKGEIIKTWGGFKFEEGE